MSGSWVQDRVLKTDRVGLLGIPPDETPPPFDPLHELDAAPDAEVRVRIETRRYGKRVTVIDDLPRGSDVQGMATKLKRRLATGGAAKDGHVELQGEFGPRVVAALAELGLRARVV